MHSSPLTPVFTTLRLGLHVLVTTLAVVVAIRALLPGAAHPVAVVTLTAMFLAVYFAGAFLGRRPRGIAVWLAALTLLWFGLEALASDAGYLVFGLFFLYLHLLPRRWRLPAVGAATAVAVIGFGLHRGWSMAGAIGPMIGAAVAVGIGLGYEALFRESAERQRLIDELLSTRAVLADQERTAGKLAERERLAQEIHDTVAQGLSSIQLLLHAAERSAPEHPALQQIRLARETAAENLAETRRLIAELTPVALEGQSLAQALERICSRAAAPGLSTRLVVEGTPERLPMPIEAALVRIAQGAVSNVVRHADAARMRLTLTYADTEVYLDVVDDGAGIDQAVLDRAPDGTFGLAAMRSRVEQQGGTMTVESEPGHTAVTVAFPLEPVAATTQQVIVESPTGTANSDSLISKVSEPQSFSSVAERGAGAKAVDWGAAAVEPNVGAAPSVAAAPRVGAEPGVSAEPGLGAVLGVGAAPHACAAGAVGAAPSAVAEPHVGLGRDASVEHGAGAEDGHSAEAGGQSADSERWSQS